MTWFNRIRIRELHPPQKSLNAIYELCPYVFEGFASPKKKLLPPTQVKKVDAGCTYVKLLKTFLLLLFFSKIPVRILKVFIGVAVPHSNNPDLDPTQTQN